MNAILYLIPAALLLSLAFLLAFIWSVRTGQYDDLDGAATRILFDEPPPRPPQQGDPG